MISLNQKFKSIEVTIFTGHNIGSVVIFQSLFGVQTVSFRSEFSKDQSTTQSTSRFKMKQLTLVANIYIGLPKNEEVPSKHIQHGADGLNAWETRHQSHS